MLDGMNVRQEEVTSATRVKLAVVVGPQTTATETGTLAFTSHYLFGAQCPMVEAILPLVNWIEENRSEWGRIMEDAEAITRFAYDMLGVVGRYLNACVLASSAAGQGDPGAGTPCLFQFIINKLDHGRYAGRQLPASLQGLLNVWARQWALAAPLPPPPSSGMNRRREQTVKVEEGRWRRPGGVAAKTAAGRRSQTRGPISACASYQGRTHGEYAGR